MARQRTIEGEMNGCFEPNWKPLIDLVGEEVVARFMAMHQVDLVTGTTLYAFKHVDTRRYIHLDIEGNAYAFVPPNGYRPEPSWEVLSEVFETLSGLHGATPNYLAAAWAAVARLEELAISSQAA